MKDACDKVFSVPYLQLPQPTAWWETVYLAIRKESKQNILWGVGEVLTVTLVKKYFKKNKKANPCDCFQKTSPSVRRTDGDMSSLSHQVNVHVLIIVSVCAPWNLSFKSSANSLSLYGHILRHKELVHLRFGVNQHIWWAVLCHHNFLFNYLYVFGSDLVVLLLTLLLFSNRRK